MCPTVRVATYVAQPHIKPSIGKNEAYKHVTNNQMKGSMKEPNILIYFFFFCPSLNRILFLMFCLLVEGECQILVF